VYTERTDDQQPVKTFAADCADPPLSVRSRPGRPHRRLDHLDSFRTEHLVERAGELAVTIANQEPRPDTVVVELRQQVTCLLRDPRPVGIRRDPGEPDATRRQLDEEQDVEPFQEQRVDGQEIALKDPRRLLPEEL
jgi:hypothetical protein